MFDSATIPGLVKLFNRRSTRLYHACQYVDFVSYTQLRGLPSRLLLEQDSLAFTPFDTDESDRSKGVWDKVFLNLSDFGAAFANGVAVTPNAYGPILLILQPQALLDCSDVAVCLRSAGAQGFDRERESFRSLDEVHNLFANPSNQWDEQIKSGDQLSKIAGYPSAGNPEISCSTDIGIIPFSRMMYVKVDPYTIGSADLVSRVTNVLRESGSDRKVYPRSGIVQPGRYSELVELVLSGFTSHQALPLTTSAHLSDWWDQLQSRRLGYQFDRYSAYLRTGTLDPLLTGENA